MRHDTHKYILATLLSLGVFLVFLLAGCGETETAEEEYLRLHIRANDNSQVAQALKLEVRDAVVAYLTPMAQGVKNKAEMQAILADKLDDVERIADDVIAQNGYDYRSHAYFSREMFPTRTYGDLTLAEGYYDAVIVALGEGAGDNWWCVAFPPLCCVAAEDNGTDGVVYRSAIAEWFRKNCN